MTSRVKEHHGNLWSCHRCNQSFNRRDNYETHQRACLFKATGKRSGTTVKKLKDNISHVGGALDCTVNEYHLNLEDEQQNASNVLDILKESTFQVENRISEEVVKKRAVKFYLLSTDVIFLTNPPAVLSTDTIEVYGSSDVHDALNSIHESLTSTIEEFQQCGSGRVLDKLLALDLHLLEFDPLRATSYIPLPTCIHNRKAAINIKNREFPLISPQGANLIFRVKAWGLIGGVGGGGGIIFFFCIGSCIKILNIRDESRRKKNSLKIQNGMNTFIKQATKNYNIL